MEIALVYLALAALLVAVAGLFVPRKVVFWCAPDDRNRTLAFTAYLTLALALIVVFVAVVPEPEPEPAPPPVPVSKPLPQHPAPLTEPVFLQAVGNHLAGAPGYQGDGSTLLLLDFGSDGASIQLKFARQTTLKVAMSSATQVVEAMLATFKDHGWKLPPSFLVECQVHMDEQDAITGAQKGHLLGFARYSPEAATIHWVNYD